MARKKQGKKSKRVGPPNQLLALRKRIRRKMSRKGRSGSVMTTAQAWKLVTLTKEHRARKHKGTVKAVIGAFGI